MSDSGSVKSDCDERACCAIPQACELVKEECQGVWEGFGLLVVATRKQRHKARAQFVEVRV